MLIHWLKNILNIGCYVYVSNNPINIIDPDGKFLLDVHQRIVSNALKGFNITFVKNYSSSLRSIIRNYHLNSAFKFGIRGNGEVISGGVTFPDLHQTHTKSAHFDQMNFSQISSNFEAIVQSTKAAVNNFKSSSDYFKGNILGFEVGKNLHGIADFYSHSNYIELYESIYGQTSIKSIPTFQDAMNDPKYSKFAELLKSNLKTGDYPGEGEGSHREMNHDVGSGSRYTNLLHETKGKKVNWNSRAAENVAARASIQYLNEVNKEIQEGK